MKKKSKKRFKFRSAAIKPETAAVQGPSDPMYPTFSADGISGKPGEMLEFMVRGKMTHRSDRIGGSHATLEVHEIGEAPRKSRESTNAADVELERMSGKSDPIEVHIQNPADAELDKLSSSRRIG